MAPNAQSYFHGTQWTQRCSWNTNHAARSEQAGETRMDLHQHEALDNSASARQDQKQMKEHSKISRLLAIIAE
jgi:hypothetical protein